MSVAFVTNTAASGNTGNTQNPTLSITVSGTNPVLLTDTGLDSTTATVTGSSWSAGSGTSGEVKNVRSGTAFASVWAIPAPVAGAGTVTINKSAAGINHQIDASCFSGADQTTPCPAADAVTSTTAALSQTLTPTNLVAGDASNGIGVNTVGDTVNGVTPNQRYLDGNTSINMDAGDATGTTGVTLTYQFGSSGNYAKVAVRIQQPTGSSNQIAWIKA